MAIEGRPYLLWVCTDCYFTHHYGEASDDDSYVPHCVPLTRISDESELTSGMLLAEHAEDCPNRIAGEFVDECECERREFSHSSCDGCGCHLAGSRFALTEWIKEN